MVRDLSSTLIAHTDLYSRANARRHRSRKARRRYRAATTTQPLSSATRRIPTTSNHADTARTPQKELLATSFQCLFCNHENSVSVKLEKKAGVGQLTCKVCGQSFQTNINCAPPSLPSLRPAHVTSTHAKDTDLSAAVDVYSDWIDACDAVAKGDSADAAGQTANTAYRDIDAWSRQVPNKAATGGAQREDRYEKDDFVEDDEGEMEENYADEDD